MGKGVKSRTESEGKVNMHVSFLFTFTVNKRGDVLRDEENLLHRFFWSNASFLFLFL